MEGCTDEGAVNYNPNANTNNDSCVFLGCTNPEAENYSSVATLDDGSCVIYGCTVDAWFICPESYNPNATVNDWSLCSFVWDGCQTSSIQLDLNNGEFPMVHLSEITEDIDDAYFFLGEKIGCMDKKASNYSTMAIVNDSSCVYSSSIFPQPATSFVKIRFLEDVMNQVIVINSSGSVVEKINPLSEKVININTQNWPPGVYYLITSSDNKNITHKFAVE